MYEVRTIGSFESGLGRACECAQQTADMLQHLQRGAKVMGSLDPLQGVDHFLGPEGWGEKLKLAAGLTVAGIVGLIVIRHLKPKRTRRRK